MRRLFRMAAGLLVLAVCALPARAQPPNPPFPYSSAQAKVVLTTSLQKLGIQPLTALDSPATLKKLAAALGTRYTDVPPLRDLKRLLLLAVNPGAMPQQELIDPDRTPLKADFGNWVAFSRLTAIRETNPDLQRVQKETWPAELTHGERVALQSFSGNAYAPINQALRSGGKIPALYELTHARIQSAFAKAPPFSPPLVVSRGVRLPDNVLNKFLQELKDSQKTGKPYVMKGYGSSTVGPNVLPGFRGNVDIHVKATHGLDLYPISLYPQEKEFLLNHASTYRVTKVEMVQGRWVVNLDQIPPKADGKAPAKPKAEAPAPGKYCGP
jgi:hypothetical protein